jgi:hypothetical protein
MIGNRSEEEYASWDNPLLNESCHTYAYSESCSLLYALINIMNSCLSAEYPFSFLNDSHGVMSLP